MERPFSCFNFEVVLNYSGGPDRLCSAEFSECEGLEMTMEPKTIREGGNNNRPIHLIGPVSYGQLTLKRGMTSNFDLWRWFEDVLKRGQEGVRASGEVIVYAAETKEKKNVQVRFQLTGCLPVKMRAPSLNAKEGLVAIEEMQIAYEMLYLKNP